MIDYPSVQVCDATGGVQWSTAGPIKKLHLKRWSFFQPIKTKYDGLNNLCVKNMKYA